MNCCHTILKLRSGGRNSVRTRTSPISFQEVIFESLSNSSIVKSEILTLLAQMKKVEPIHHPKSNTSNHGRSSSSLSASASRVNTELFAPELIVIGASTGGPEALERFFTSIDSEILVPVLVAQHMPVGFTKGLSERLMRVSGFPFAEAQHNQTLVSGTVLVAPGDFHLTLKKSSTSESVVCILDKGPLVNSVRPAVDPLFESAAKLYGSKVLGIVFTGMGEDGALGAKIIKESGGCIASQDEASCVVFGMPGAVSRLHLNDFEGNPEKIAKWVERQMRLKGAKSKQEKQIA
jgi:two-component system chemotaxis response regulator CheB